MNYPYAQGFPGQPGLPGGYPPISPRRPGGASAMIAGILGLFGGIAALVFAVLGATLMATDRGFSAKGALNDLLFVTYGLLLSIGANLLLLRKSSGRWLVVGGCGMAVLTGVTTLVQGIVNHSPDLVVGTIMTTLLLFICPVLTLISAVVPATAKWLKHQPNSTTPQAYPPYPPAQG